MNLFFLLFVVLNSSSFAAVRILTFHYNQPEFVEFQYNTLRKFLSDDFEMIVFNDAATIENKRGIEAVCSEYGIKCVRFEPEWHLTDPLNTYLKACLENTETIPHWDWNASTTIEQIGKHPSVRHCHAIQYALDHYGYDHDDIVVIMDGDNFVIKPLSIRALLDSSDIVGFTQGCDMLGKGRKAGQISPPYREGVSWEASVVFVAFNPSRMPNARDMKFHVDIVTGHATLPDHRISDSGSGIYMYLKQHPGIMVKQLSWQDSGIFRSYFSRQELIDIGFADSLIQFIYNLAPQNMQFFAFETFLHFSNVSFEVPAHEFKVQQLRDFMNRILYID